MDGKFKFEEKIDFLKKVIFCYLIVDPIRFDKQIEKFFLFFFLVL
jgi:hypothetical protein